MHSRKPFPSVSEKFSDPYPSVFICGLKFCSRFLSFLLLASPWLSSAAQFPFFEPVQPPRVFQVMVHRGEARQAPENSRSALQRCIEDNLEWAEIDLRLTKD